MREAKTKEQTAHSPHLANAILTLPFLCFSVHS